MKVNMEYASKTELYQKVKKPLLERERRARINKCLDALKHMVAEFQGDDAVLRMDKAELLEATIDYMRLRTKQAKQQAKQQAPTIDSFKQGYVNAVNEVSRVLASTPGVSVELGKSVMTHLGHIFNVLQKKYQQQQQQQQQQNRASYNMNYMQSLSIDCVATSAAAAASTLSPASSGYHSDCDSPMNSPVAPAHSQLWRPW